MRHAWSRCSEGGTAQPMREGPAMALLSTNSRAEAHLHQPPTPAPSSCRSSPPSSPPGRRRSSARPNQAIDPDRSSIPHSDSTVLVLGYNDWRSSRTRVRGTAARNAFSFLPRARRGRTPALRASATVTTSGATCRTARGGRSPNPTIVPARGVHLCGLKAIGA